MIDTMPRPAKPIDWKIVDDMILKGETEKLICERFDIDVTNFIDRFKAEHNTNFTNYAQSKRAEGLRLLRSHTFNRAMQGNDKCLMHLNRHMRGEWDKKELNDSTQQSIIVQINGPLASGIKVPAERVSNPDNQSPE